jgi:nucleoside phosphorylase
MNTIIMTIPIPHLCVVTAADIEFKAVAHRLEGRTFSATNGIKRCQGRAGRNLVTVLQSEVGAPGFREKLTAHLAKTKYEVLFIIGLAGALSPNLKTGEVIFYDTCFAFRPDFSTGDETDAAPTSVATGVCDFQVASSLRQLLLADGLECMFGAGLTLDFMVTSAEEKLSMGESYGAAAVDMESYDLIHVATQFGLPVVALRVILDEAQQKTPDFNMAILANGQMSPAKSLLAMLLRPIATIRFFLSLLFAMKALRRVAKLALKAEPKLIRPARALVKAKKMWA